MFDHSEVRPSATIWQKLPVLIVGGTTVFMVMAIRAFRKGAF